MVRKTYTVEVKTVYEVKAASERDAQFFACAVAAGCQTTRDSLSTPRCFPRATVVASRSDVLSTTERKTADQIIAEFGTKTEDKKE